MLAVLQQKKILAPRDVTRMKDTQHMLLNLIFDHSKKSPEDVAKTADVLDTFGCKKEAAMLRGKLVLIVYIECNY